MKKYFKLLLLTLTLTLTTTTLSAMKVTPYSKTELKYKEKNEELFNISREAFKILNTWGGDPQILIKAYKKIEYILEKDPEYTLAYRELARLLMMAGDHDSAFKALYKSIELEPKYENAYVLLGYHYMVIDELDKAKESLEEGRKLGSELPWLDLNLAMIYDKEEKFEESGKLYYKVFKSKTTNLKAYGSAYGGILKHEQRNGNIKVLGEIQKEFREHVNNVSNSTIK